MLITLLSQQYLDIKTVAYLNAIVVNIRVFEEVLR